MSQPAFSTSPYATAREAMVVSQLYPSGIVNEAVLAAYRATPRELFVPSDRQAVCYLDSDVALANGRTLLEPLVHALMVENAQIKKTDKVLDIGGVTGYSAAILAQLCKAVVAVEPDHDALEVAQSLWQKLGFTNIMAVSAPVADGCAAYAPYDVILVNGALPSVPQSLQDQLAPSGRLLCIEAGTSTSVGHIKLYTKQGNTFSAAVIADASVPYLPGCTPLPAFTF